MQQTPMLHTNICPKEWSSQQVCILDNRPRGCTTYMINSPVAIVVHTLIRACLYWIPNSKTCTNNYQLKSSDIQLLYHHLPNFIHLSHTVFPPTNPSFYPIFIIGLAVISIDRYIVHRIMFSTPWHSSHPLNTKHSSLCDSTEYICTA